MRKRVDSPSADVAEPLWYKSQSYRSRVAGKPREVLQGLGHDLDEDVQK